MERAAHATPSFAYPTHDVGIPTLYVAPTGSNDQDGRSPATAFETISRAALAAGPGDVVEIRGGTYSEYVVLQTSGTAERPITFMAHPGEQVTIDGSGRAPNPDLMPGNDGNPPLLTVAGSYIMVKGLEIKNAAGCGVNIYGDHVTLDALHVHNNFLAGIDAWKAADGVIENCTVHDNYDYRPNNAALSGDTGDGIALNGPSIRMTVRNNTVYHNSDDGIDVWDSSNNVIEGNTIYNNGYGTGGDGEGVKIGPGTGNIVRNNRAYGNRLSGFVGGETGGNEIRNNIAYGNWRDFNNSQSNNQPRPNIFADNVGDTIYRMGKAVQINNSWNPEVRFTPAP
ncbi:right-handed parallel beta-helix repeat-containing protein [Nitrospira sp. Nam74]